MSDKLEARKTALQSYYIDTAKQQSIQTCDLSVIESGLCPVEEATPTLKLENEVDPPAPLDPYWYCIDCNECLYDTPTQLCINCRNK